MSELWPGSDPDTCRVAAHDAFRRAVACDPGHAPAWAGLSRLMHDLDRDRESVECAEHGVASDPRHADAWAALAAALVRVERYGDALTAADQAVRLDASHASAHSLRGDALSGLGREDDAFDAWEVGNEVSEHLAAAGIFAHPWHEDFADWLSRTAGDVNARPEDAAAWTVRGELLADLADRL